MHAVDDQRVDREPALGEPVGEELGLLDGVAARRGHEHERGRRRPRGAARPTRRGRGSPAPCLRTRGRTRPRRRRPRVPTTLRDACGGRPAPRRRATRRYARVGTISKRKIRLSSRRVSRRGASRKSSACRVGGVSTTMRSKPPSVVQLVQLLHRHVLLRARERAGDVAVEAVLEDALDLLLVLGVAHDQPVERGLGVEHHRRAAARYGAASPVGIPAAPVDLVHGVSERCSSPSVSARRFAGSIVTTTALRPRLARLRSRTPRRSSSCRRRRCRSTR